MEKIPANDLPAAMMQYASRHRLLAPGSKVLAAVSGGIDSIVMLHLLHAAGVYVAVAHCNFSLRGGESDGDEAFVRNEAKKLGIQCFVTRFDTNGYASQKGLSIQMAARELRYQWFDELASQYGYDAIAIAHNRDDRIETLFINLARGTGIRGLSGIKPRNEKIIRPLIFASRGEIVDYAKANGIAFREDSSNASDKYARNYIRHHVIPGLEQFFPGLQPTIERNIKHFSAVEAFYAEAIEKYKQAVVSTKGDLIYIDLNGLMQSPSPSTLLYEILKPFGFPNTIAVDILDNIQLSGRQFFSGTHRLLRDRHSLVLQKLEETEEQPYLIDENTTGIQSPIPLRIEKFTRGSGFVPDTAPNIACLDADKLQFPLLLRKWEPGDTFQPLGMKNMKKLSDFFTDNKLSLIEKERCWVLVSGGQIAWIAGRRIDDRFKITDKTTRVVRIMVTG